MSAIDCATSERALVNRARRHEFENSSQKNLLTEEVAQSNADTKRNASTQKEGEQVNIGGEGVACVGAAR